MINLTRELTKHILIEVLFQILMNGGSHGKLHDISIAERVQKDDDWPFLFLFNWLVAAFFPLLSEYLHLAKAALCSPLQLNKNSWIWPKLYFSSHLINFERERHQADLSRKKEKPKKVHFREEPKVHFEIQINFFICHKFKGKFGTTCTKLQKQLWRIFWICENC